MGYVASLQKAMPGFGTLFVHEIGPGIASHRQSKNDSDAHIDTRLLREFGYAVCTAYALTGKMMPNRNQR